MTSVSTDFQVPADILDTTSASPQTGKAPSTLVIEVDEAAVLDTAAAAPQVSKAPISR